MAISQDKVIGNQQKKNSFWKRIREHYEKERPGSFRLACSLESKWRQIKHDMNKFIGAYKQTIGLQVTGTSPADTMRMANELYRTKHAKGCDFTFEHCWVLIKDLPCWAEDWRTVKNVTPSKRKTASSIQGSYEAINESHSIAEKIVTGDAYQGLRDRPTGTKSAKEVIRDDKVAEKALIK